VALSKYTLLTGLYLVGVILCWLSTFGVISENIGMGGFVAVLIAMAIHWFTRPPKTKMPQ
jgi:hypothetical protein